MSLITSKNSDEANNGVLVVKISSDSPALKSGLHLGDRITAMNSIKINNLSELIKILSYIMEERITLEVDKSGETKRVEMSIGE